MSSTTLDDAFSLLLKRLSIPVSEQVTLDGNPENLLTITDHYPELMVIAMGHPGTWPETNDALISFQINSEANQYPDIQEAYYLVADYEQQLVINPKNNKPVHILAEPIGWISYGPSADPIGNLVEKPEHRYTWVKHDNIWDVARRTGQDAKELLEHNDISNTDNIHPGTILHLPRPNTRITSEPTITYELHSPSKQMYISREGGAHKWAFGSITSGTGRVKSGYTWAQNAPVEIVATAHVPVAEGTAHYHMTASDLGTYRETGTCRPIGFDHTDLSDGQPPEKPADVPAPIVTPEVVIADVKFASHMEDPNAYKISWHKFRETGIYRVKRAAWVKEYDGRQQDHFLSEDEKVELVGTFMRGEMFYGRPWSSTNNFWFGIPMSCLEPIDENADIDEIAKITPVEKAADHRSGGKRPFSPPEKVWDVVAHNVGRGIKFTDSVKKKLTRKV